MENKENSLLKEITTIFFKIENNIVELNQRSYDDFSELNEKLNKNLHISSGLSDNLKALLKVIGKDGNTKILKNLIKDLDDLRISLGEMESVLDCSYDTLGVIISDLSMISTPMKNFNQNLSSLYLLIVNLKLLSTCENRSPDGFNVQESGIIEKVINKVKNVCPIIEENIFVLKNHLESLQKDILSLKKNELTNVANLIELTSKDINNLVDQVELGLEAKLKIEKLADDYFIEINNLIIGMEKQADIHREVKSFHKTHDIILRELVKAEYNGSKVRLNNIDELKIPKMSDSQISRVLQINEKYQESVSEITNGMILNREKIKSIINNSRCFATRLSENDNSRFDLFVDSFASLLNGYQKYTKEINLINKVINELNDRYIDTEMIERAVEQKIIDKIHVGEFLIRPEKELAFNSQKVYKLYSDNHFEKHKLQNKFEDVVDSITIIVKENTFFSYKNGGVQFFETALNNSKEYIKKIRANCELFERKQNEIEQAGIQIIDNVNNALEQVKYYRFFDKTVKQVVLLLEKINKEVQTKNKPQIKNRKNSKLIVEKELLT